MAYKAEIEIDDDRWCKHPYGVIIYDENGDRIEYHNFLNSRNDCYKYSDKYGIPHGDITESFY